MNERPTKMIDGIRIIGVIDPAGDGCFKWLRGEQICCTDYELTSCRCPFRTNPNLKGFWLPEDQALPLLLTGDVK